VQGTVVPATNADVKLWVELADGRRIEGKSQIDHASSPIVQVGCLPERPPALPKALEAIADADLIVLGPGSLHTSLLPNLLVPELAQAISRSKAPRLYICNLMTQPGETDGLDVEGRLRAIESQLASLGIQQRLFSSVLAQNGWGTPSAIDLQLFEHSKPKRERCGRSRKRELFCPAHPKQRIEGNGRKYFLHLLSAE